MMTRVQARRQPPAPSGEPAASHAPKRRQRLPHPSAVALKRSKAAKASKEVEWDNKSADGDASEGDTITVASEIPKGHLKSNPSDSTSGAVMVASRARPKKLNSIDDTSSAVVVTSASTSQPGLNSNDSASGTVVVPGEYRLSGVNTRSGGRSVTQQVTSGKLPEDTEASEDEIFDALEPQDSEDDEKSSGEPDNTGVPLEIVSLFNMHTKYSLENTFLLDMRTKRSPKTFVRSICV